MSREAVQSISDIIETVLSRYFDLSEEKARELLSNDEFLDTVDYWLRQYLSPAGAVDCPQMMVMLDMMRRYETDRLRDIVRKALEKALETMKIEVRERR